MNKLGIAGKNGYKLDFSTNTLYLNYKFCQAAGIYGSAEQKLLKDIMASFPDMKIVRYSGRNCKSPHTNKHLTYKNMEAYISCFQNSNELLAKFNLAKELSVTTASPYKYVSDWFKAQFPDYKNHTALSGGAKPYIELVSMPATENYKQKAEAKNGNMDSVA